MAAISTKDDRKLSEGVTATAINEKSVVTLSADDVPQALARNHGTVWVDIRLSENGDPSPDVRTLLDQVFSFHPLAIEDALLEEQSPKLDDWGDYLQICCQSSCHSKSAGLKLGEIDFFLGKNYLVSLHTGDEPAIERVRDVVASREGCSGRKGPDLLLHAIMDQVADQHLTTLESLDEEIDSAQDEVISKPTTKTLHKILVVKRAALRLHRVLAPQREIFNKMARDPYDEIAEEHRVYFRDVYDHYVRIHDSTETLRDLITSALDTYLSAVSNRTNDVMKILTIVTVMFLPMNTIVGFWGMNFFGDNVHLPVSLPRWLLFVVSMAAMLGTPFMVGIWAKRKGWF